MRELPLIAFVNIRSGGQQGIKVQERLKKHIPEENIFDLSQGGPAPGLSKFKGSRFLVLVCGGDGTVGWVLSEIDKLQLTPELIPPVAVLPIGTGNDLARTLKWGGGYTGGGLREIIKQVNKSCIVMMDKWKVSCESTSENPEPVKDLLMNNYISVGADADVALKFHELRKAHPEKFTSRTQNKAWYVRIAMANISPESLFANVTLEIDGHEVALTEKVAAVLVLNLPSYSGGGDPWGPHKNSHKKRGFSSPAIDDGLLEVVGLTGPIQVAAIHARIAKAKKFGQGREVKLTLRKALSIQVDGEPWSQPPAVVTIRHAGTSVMLANSPATHPFPATRTVSPLVSPLAASSSSAPPSPVEERRPLERTRSSSMPVNNSPSPLRYGPVEPDKRKKNRLYCEACGLEFFLPHMLSNHTASGLCSGGASSSKVKGHDSVPRSMSVQINEEKGVAEWRTQSAEQLGKDSDSETRAGHEEDEDSGKEGEGEGADAGETAGERPPSANEISAAAVSVH